jgi:hypothetical protein
MGPVGPDAAAAVFYNFNPALFAFALPGAWAIASPEQVLEARARAMEEVYRRVGAPTADLDEALDLAGRAAAGTDTAGRPLAAANKAVAPLGEPFADLWQALAVVREHRGDGHVALLTTEGVDPVEALILYSEWQSTVSRRFLQATRLWDDEAWAAGEERLRSRGLLAADGATDEGATSFALTEEGRALREHLERRTDQLAAGPWAAIGEEASLRLFDLMHPILVALDDARAFPRALSLPDRPA